MEKYDEVSVPLNEFNPHNMPCSEGNGSKYGSTDIRVEILSKTSQNRNLAKIPLLVFMNLVIILNSSMLISPLVWMKPEYLPFSVIAIRAGQFLSGPLLSYVLVKFGENSSSKLLLAALFIGSITFFGINNWSVNLISLALIGISSGRYFVLVYS